MALRYEQAVCLYKRSLAIQETLLETATLESFKIAAVKEATDAYQQTALLLMEMNRTAEAFDMIASKKKQQCFFNIRLNEFFCNFRDILFEINP